MAKASETSLVKWPRPSARSQGVEIGKTNGNVQNYDLRVRLNVRGYDHDDDHALERFLPHQERETLLGLAVGYQPTCEWLHSLQERINILNRFRK